MISFFNSLKLVLSHPNNIKRPLRALLVLLIWKINQLTIKKPFLIELTPGIKCICYPQSSYGSMVVYTHFPDYYELKFLLKNLHSKSIFFDVGSNIGVYSLIAASRIKKGKIFAFEPGKNVLPTLRENISINNLNEKITLVTNVVANKTGRVAFIIEPTPETNHIDFGQVFNKHELISSISLDNFCQKNKIRHIDFLKIDVEGAEQEVLEGSRKLIEKGKIGLIILEINQSNNKQRHKPKRLKLFLEEHGYLFYNFSGKGELVALTKGKDFPFQETTNVIASRTPLS